MSVHLIGNHVQTQQTRWNRLSLDNRLIAHISNAQNVLIIRQVLIEFTSVQPQITPQLAVYLMTLTDASLFLSMQRKYHFQILQ